MHLSPNVIELLRALADGKQIQWRADGPEGWVDCDADAALAYMAAGHTPALRVKPEFIRFECKVPRPLDCAPPAGGARSTSSPTWGARASSAGKSGQGARPIVECWSAGSSTCSPQTRTSTPTPC